MFAQHADDVGTIDFDFVRAEKFAMVTAKKQLLALSIPFEQRGQKIRIKVRSNLHRLDGDDGELEI